MKPAWHLRLGSWPVSLYHRHVYQISLLPGVKNHHVRARDQKNNESPILLRIDVDMSPEPERAAERAPERPAERTSGRAEKRAACTKAWLEAGWDGMRYKGHGMLWIKKVLGSETRFIFSLGKICSRPLSVGG